MMRGHWLVWESKPYRLLRDLDTTIIGPKGMPVKAVAYEMVDLDSNYLTVVGACEAKYGISAVTNPHPQMLPACDSADGCGARIGHPCVDDCWPAEEGRAKR